MSGSVHISNRVRKRQQAKVVVFGIAVAFAAIIAVNVSNIFFTGGN